MNFRAMLRNTGKILVITVVLVVFFMAQTLPLCAQDAIRIPTDLSAVKVIKEEAPAYPPDAKAAFYEATVSVEATIDTNGIVTDAVVTSVAVTENEELRKKVITEEKETDETMYEKQARLDDYKDAFGAAAVAAAKNWRFEPFKSAGKKVSVAYPLEFKFNLKVSANQSAKTPSASEEGDSGTANDESPADGTATDDTVTDDSVTDTATDVIVE